MSLTIETNREIDALAAPERTGLLRRLLNLNADFPGIVRDDGVCGGSARIVRTRIPVWSVELLRRLGADDRKLLEAYPSLTVADLRNASLYSATFAEEIDREIRENEEP